MIFYDVCDVFRVVCDRQFQLVDNSHVAALKHCVVSFRRVG